MRVFAGPNGSGKSTIINSIRSYRENEFQIDFGTYVNADDIAVMLRKNKFHFNKYNIKTTKEEFIKISISSGLISGSNFTLSRFLSSFRFSGNGKINLLNKRDDEALAQILADFLRKKLLSDGRKFSFETVFSHSSKIEIMKHAKNAGYKIYLYFVCTESPEINIRRVKKRVKQNGHDVPVDRLKSRYNRSLRFLYGASQLAYQAFFFDNSTDQLQPYFAHFKIQKGVKLWDEMDIEKIPMWFYKHYFAKVKKKK
ncbi:MAG: zeta toxin family protein [Bacteroidetes bacterium]|nr:zeta toxin family protein [Bacteroidota bacterium]